MIATLGAAPLRGAGPRCGAERGHTDADSEGRRAGEQYPAGGAVRFGAGFVAQLAVLVDRYPQVVGGGVVGE
ncbi:MULTISPECIES: hypothetical protein [unclassified Kitasatospora]|uniref:hypothetical protein n=1 Tax=unclassified Kitasatospora TaxID=2633591 RepID=UPI0033E16D35